MDKKKLYVDDVLRHIPYLFNRNLSITSVHRIEVKMRIHHLIINWHWWWKLLLQLSFCAFYVGTKYAAQWLFNRTKSKIVKVQRTRNIELLKFRWKLFKFSWEHRMARRRFISICLEIFWFWFIWRSDAKYGDCKPEVLHIWCEFNVSRLNRL